MSSVRGKRILVTGAGKGIGRGLVKKLDSLGATVFALTRTEEDLKSLEDENPGVKVIRGDVTDWDQTRSEVEKWGPYDGLVNNAAVAALAPFLDVQPETIDILFNVNVKGVFNMSQVVAKGMIDNKIKGSIVNVSSQASKRGLWEHAVYNSTKGALDSLTQVMALELGSHGIRVNTVNPTVVLTKMGKLGWSDPKKAGPMLNRIPLGRFAEVDEVVDVIIFLLSESSSMVSGAHLPVDGGFWAA